MATSSRRIRVVNPQLSDSEKTQLDADYTTGTTLEVISNFGYQNDDIVVIGEPGTEKSESTDCTGTTSNTIIDISANLKFAHQAGTPVYRSEYNQVEFSVDTGSGWTVLDTTGIKWDDNETIYIHQGGTNAYSYRFRFKNSVSGDTTEYSGTITGSGYAKNSVGRMVTNVRKAINDPNRKIVSDSEIMLYLTMAKDIILAERSDWYFWKKVDEGTITTEASVRKYDLDDISDSMEYVDSVRYRDASLSPVEIYPLEFLSEIEFDTRIIDQSETTDDSLKFYTIQQPDSSSTSGYILVDPNPKTTGNGSFYIRYYQPDDDYEDVADTTSIPIPSVLELFAIAQCEKIKGNDARASIFEKLFFGPASGNKRVSVKTGVALLENMQANKLRPTKQPRSLKKFMGRGAVKRLFRGHGVNEDSQRERYW